MTTENKSKTEINGLTYKYSDEMTVFTWHTLQWVSWMIIIGFFYDSASKLKTIRWNIFL